MPLKLYKMDLSPPVCAALMICDIHNVPVEMVDVNLIANEHMKPEYMKKNPLHTVPMLEDGDFIIHDSHVILTYLTDVYGKDDSLYPKDPKKRAQVDQKLYFNTLLFQRMRSVTFPAFFEGVRKPAEKLLNDIEEAYGFLEAFLTNTKFVAANNMTIADVSVLPTTLILRTIVAIDAEKYPKLTAWLKYMESQPFFIKSAQKGSSELQKLIKGSLDI